MRHLLLSISVFALVTGGAAIGYALHDRVTHAPATTPPVATTPPAVGIKPGHLHHHRPAGHKPVAADKRVKREADERHTRQAGDDIADQLNAEQLR